MKKISVRNLYLIFIICIGLVCLGVGSTYAVFTASSEIISPISLSSNLTYESGVLETINVKVLPGEVISTKINITNNSNSNLNYVTWYIDEGYDINVVGETGDMQGVISPSSTSTIVVSVRNSGDYTTTVNIGVSSSEDSIVLGKNMKVVGSANFMMGVDVYPSDNTALFLRSNLQRGEIESITFVDNINIPEGNTSVDISKHSDSSVMMWYGAKNSNNLYDVYIGSKNGTTFLSSGKYLFKSLTNVKTIDFSNYVNTSNVTDMSYMFNECSSLTELNVSNFDTSKVIHMGNMFQNCRELTNLDVSNFDTSKVTNMASMFSVCINLTELDLNNWNTSSLNNMESMFYLSENLINIYIGNFDTSKVTNMANTFSACRNLIELDVSNWNVSKVTNMRCLFNECYKLTKLDVSNWNTSNATNMYGMFKNCKGITELNLVGFDTSNVTAMEGMFFNSVSLVKIYVSKDWIINENTNTNSMFEYCLSLVGGNGTTYDDNYIDGTYARIDTTGTPGYFTYKNV